MAIIEIRKDPSARELRWFGMGILLFALAFATLTWWRGAPGLARLLLGAGAAVTIAYYAVSPLRRPIYLAWMYAAYPIGWVVSHALLGAVFFLVVTPIGLLVRLFGRDPLNRRRNPAAASYWVPHDPGTKVARYFRQF